MKRNPYRTVEREAIVAELESADGSWWTCSVCGDIHQGESNTDRQQRLRAAALSTSNQEAS